MTHKAEHEKVAQIVSWKTDAFYIVEVVYRDGKTATLYNVTVDHWAAIKAEELECNWVGRRRACTYPS
jgi:hypothetical protein